MSSGREGIVEIFARDLAESSGDDTILLFGDVSFAVSFRLPHILGADNGFSFRYILSFHPSDRLCIFQRFTSTLCASSQSFA